MFSPEPLIPEEDIPGLYDDDFRTASDRFLPQYEWEWLKAQCYQESLLDPLAQSRAGAMGLCQFMPRTWDEVSKALNLNASVFNPKANALAAGFYMGRLDGEWSIPRPPRERLKLAQASYNAGLGNILKAQKKCNNELFWKDIEPCLGYAETRIYVLKIGEYYTLLTK